MENMFYYWYYFLIEFGNSDEKKRKGTQVIEEKIMCN